MRRIHTFQKYSQRENWVTNNTLLFLSRFHQYSTKKFETVINEILQENKVSLNIGVTFWQQEKGSNSVLDGTISQEEFKISIETKLFDNFSVDQLERHIASISSMPGKNRILLALSKSDVPNDLKSQVVSFLKRKYPDIKFVSLSFCTLIDTVRANIASFEVEMLEVVEEFEGFCRENSLLKDDSRYMLVLTAGTSLRENLQFGLYYDPVERNHNTEFDMIGLYSNKTIVAIGDVKSCVVADLEGDTLVIKTPSATAQSVRDRIKQIIEVTDYYDIRAGHKFYVVEKFHPTDFRKRTPGPLRGKIYFRLQDLPETKPDISARELADILNGRKWD